ncbi:MAG: dockerin type I domain-containing protein [Planctomycetota bacterium]
MKTRHACRNLSTAALLGAVAFAPPALAVDGADSAGDTVYVAGGWADGQNGGFGFGPWTLIAEAPAGGFAGFFSANDAGGGLGVDNIGVEEDPAVPFTTPASEGRVWGTFANKGAGIEQASAFRPLSASLDGAGDSLGVSMEHGFVNGQAGVALRTANVATAAADFDTGARAQFYFEGGSAGYTLEDDAGPVVLDGTTPGLPLIDFTFFGVEVEYTLTGPDTYDIEITKFNSEAGSGGAAPDVFNKTTHAGLGGRSLAGTGTIDSVALYQFDVEQQSDAFFNNLAYAGSGSGGGSGADEAANYAGFWLDGDDFGTGFGAWEFTSETDGGFAGTFVQSGLGNGVDNAGSSGGNGDVWASFANQGNFSDKAVQFRDLDNAIQAAGDSFSVDIEHGFIDTGGIVGVALRDNAVDFGNETPDDFSTDALFQFFFEGGDGNYTVVDASGEIDTGVAFSFFGVSLDLTLTSATTFDLDITRFDEANDPAPSLTTLTNLTFAGTLGDGTIESLALFNIDAPNQSDVFFNSLSYTLDAVAAVPGDANGDGDVDLLDFDILAGNFGAGPGAVGGVSIGDFNGDGNVDLLDFDILAGNFGFTSPGSLPGAVPEPASMALLGLGSLTLLRGRRRRVA